MKYATKYPIQPMLSLNKDEAEEEGFKRKLSEILSNEKINPGLRQVLYEDMMKRVENFKETVKGTKQSDQVPIIIVPSETDTGKKKKKKKAPKKAKATPRRRRQQSPDSYQVNTAISEGAVTPVQPRTPGTPQAPRKPSSLDKATRSGMGYGPDRLRVTKWHGLGR